MITPYFKTLLELAKKQHEQQQTDLFQNQLNKSLLTPESIADRLLNQSLKEAKTAEDTDTLILPSVPETCKLCDDKEEIHAWIMNEVVTRSIVGYNIHCSGTHVNATVTGMLNHWKSLGWINPGYHIAIHKNGSVTIIAPLQVISNGVAGYNHNRINICTIGGLDSNGKIADTMTPEQDEMLVFIIKSLDKKFGYQDKKGHRDFPRVTKACPCYDFRKKYPLL